MTEIKSFKCKFCKPDKRRSMTRKDLRKHLKSEHRIMTNITNSAYVRGKRYIKQDWWLEDD